MMKFVILLIVGVIAKQSYGEPPIAKRIAKPIAAPRPIVGGQDATTGQFKHQVSFQFGKKHNCGGSIISPTHIVTAAHCIPEDKRQYKFLSIVTGTTKWKEGQIHDIKCIRVHPNYVNFLDDDIAVITLRKPIVFSDVQAPIPLTNTDHSNDNGTPVVVSGWGRLGRTLPIPDILQWVRLKIVPISVCSKETNHHICTYLQPGKGFCKGDSGGPLIYNGELIGVVSHGVTCAVGVPDVYINIYPYKDFIRESQEQCS